MGIDPMLPLDNAGTGALGPARPSASMSFSWLILGRLLSSSPSGQLKIVSSEDARQRSGDRPALCRNRCSLGSIYMLIFITGRTSTAPSRSKMGQPFESSTA